jgi:hypothetical protein
MIYLTSAYTSIAAIAIAWNANVSRQSATCTERDLGDSTISDMRAYSHAVTNVPRTTSDDSSLCGGRLAYARIAFTNSRLMVLIANS